ncbi:MAG: hypothetical protein JNK85_15850, partial [Verrucomicrobiales bacterium]|nr:hypothetical protein [Verrucomicrobiales bacterium]
QARRGWRFAGWRELPGNLQTKVRLAMQADVTLTALFAPESSITLAIPGRQQAGVVRVRAKGPPNASLALEVSGDMTNWSPFSSSAANADGEAEWDVPLVRSAQFIRASLPP